MESSHAYLSMMIPAYLSLFLLEANLGSPLTEPPRVASAVTVPINIICEMVNPLEVEGYMLE